MLITSHTVTTTDAPYRYTEVEIGMGLMDGGDGADDRSAMLPLKLLTFYLAHPKRDRHLYLLIL